MGQDFLDRQKCQTVAISTQSIVHRSEVIYKTDVHAEINDKKKEWQQNWDKVCNTGCLRNYRISILLLRLSVLGRLRDLQYIFPVIYRTPSTPTRLHIGTERKHWKSAAKVQICLTVHLYLIICLSLVLCPSIRANMVVIQSRSILTSKSWYINVKKRDLVGTGCTSGNHFNAVYGAIPGSHFSPHLNVSLWVRP